MTTPCQDVQQELMEVGGDLTRLGSLTRSHVDRCPRCAAVAGQESELRRMLAGAAAGADEAAPLVLPPVPMRRRLVPWLPVALSAGLGAAGAAWVEGLPGVALMVHLPELTARGWAAAAAFAADLSLALVTTVRAAAPVVGGEGAVIAGLAALAGLGFLATMSRRWRRAFAWRSES